MNKKNILRTKENVPYRTVPVETFRSGYLPLEIKAEEKNSTGFNDAYKSYLTPDDAHSGIQNKRDRQILSQRITMRTEKI